MDVTTRGGGAGGVAAVVEYDYTAKEPDELDLVKGAIIHNIKQMPGGWWEGKLQSNGKTGMFPDNFVRIIDASSEELAVTLRDKSAASNRRCKVIYSYTQVNDDELSLAMGDVIEFLGEVEEGWWRGRLKNKVGVFPSNFVIAIEPSPILASKRPASHAATAINSNSNSAAAMRTAGANSSANAAITAPSAGSGTAGTVSTKKTNRLSFHSSKEDLLSSTTAATSSSAMAATTTTATAAADDGAPSLPPKPQRDFCRVEFPYAPQNDDELELKVGDIVTIISMELPDKGWWKGESRGKVGVFPDNFVKLLAPSDVSPLNDAQQTHRTAKNSNAGHVITSSNNAHITSTSTTISNNNSHSSSAATSKVFVKKSGSSSSTQSSNRKDSFGSRDSLNDILSETGLPSGNVAAQRKSLENKNLDLSNPPDASSRLGLKKQQLHQETKTHSSSSSSSTTNTTTVMSSNSSASELRKSLENMDEKSKTTPPPVLTKKPSVPTKKAATVTSVAGNIFSGLKQKVKNVESKLTTTVSQDSADGVGSSRISPGGGLPDSAPSGNVVMRRAATIAVEDSDFDRVERASILQDVRAGRVKAPKRRPPSAAINAIGESNNNNSIYLNGSADLLLQSGEEGSSKPQSSDDNSTGEEQLTKPKPREWEKKKAPWMEELKASQVKKKTSPSVEPRSGAVDGKISNSNSSAVVASNSVISTTNSSSSSSSTSTKVQSSAISSSSVMQQSLTVESSRKELLSSSSTSNNAEVVSMSKSVSSKLSNDVVAADDMRTRPNSLSIRNRSISPTFGNGSSNNSNSSAARAALKTNASPATTSLLEAASSSAASSTALQNSTAAKTTNLYNHQENNLNMPTATSASSAAKPTTAAGTDVAAGSVVAGGGVVRVTELEKRIEKLESVVHAQQRTIDELVRTLREETDRVKLLRGELDKYAQCVTQV